MERFEARAKESMDKFEAQIQQAGDRYKTELKQIMELENRRAEVETVVGPSLPLVGMLKSREDLKKVSPPYILQLLEKIQTWFEMNVPGASIEPPECIWANEHGLHTVCSYNLAVLVELTREGLKQRMMWQQKT